MTRLQRKAHAILWPLIAVAIVLVLGHALYRRSVSRSLSSPAEEQR